VKRHTEEMTDDQTQPTQCTFGTLTWLRAHFYSSSSSLFILIGYLLSPLVIKFKLFG